MVITIVGASTAFFAATSGLVQNDLKRVIAFSTISQLGYPWFLGSKQSTFLNTSLFYYISSKMNHTGTKVRDQFYFKRGLHNLRKVVEPLLAP